jgi:hypothetical protein
LQFYYESKRLTKAKGRWHILMNWQEGEWCWLNNGYPDEIDEDLTVFASSSGVMSGKKQNQGDCELRLPFSTIRYMVRAERAGSEK